MISSKFKFAEKLLLLTIVLLFALSSVQIFSTASLSKQGSQGDEVTQIQTKLQEQGYYNGNVDGVFGSGTKRAVVAFQQDNGLKSDGIVGSATLKALGIGGSSSGGSGGGSASGNFSDSEVALLARIISAESRGEPYEGQVAVGAVILNRIDHPSFPNTLSGVIYQPGAFTCVTDGQIDADVADSAIRAANDAMNGWDPTGGAIYYFNPSTATSKWIWSREVILEIGKHKFCL